MSLSKEVRIGLLVAVAGVILFTGFYFLKGASIFSSDKKYYCYYANVDGLQNSANVQINGLNVGHVLTTKLAGSRGVQVVITMDKSIEITEGTVADLASFDLLGTKLIKLIPGPGPGKMADGAEMQTAAEGGVVDNVSAQLTPRLQELKSTIISLDTTLSSVNNIVDTKNREALAAAIKNLNATSENMARLTAALSNESGEITSIIHNANSITGNLAKENDTVKHILSNVNTVTKQLADAPIQKTLTDLQHTTAQLQGIMDKINNSQGSLGLLINNKDMYNNLNSSLHSINSLVEDLQAHPKKYINVSVFGK